VFSVESQTRSQTVPAGRAAVYEFQVRYIGSGTETLRLQGATGGGGWTVRYYDALSGGRDITGAVGSAVGHAVPRVNSGTARTFRVEVTAGPQVGAEHAGTILISGWPESSPVRRDTIRTITTCEPRVQPDLMVRREFDYRHLGDNVFNRTGAGQTKAQETDPDVSISYYVRLVNDGNRADVFTLRGDGGAGGWRVRYVDALVGGADVTAAVTGEGWVLPALALNAAVEFRVEVAGDASVQGVSISQVLLTAESANDPARADAVRMLTAIIPDSTMAQGGLYTTSEDFERGNLAGVTGDGVRDQLQLAAESMTLPFLWVPNSNEGTVSKIDTRTGRELARYRTGPDRLNGNPSRTTIDQQGNCWVANRRIGTAVKIGLFEGGQCADRDGDGLIETSTDRDGDGDITADEMLPWGEDECVLLEVVLIPGLEQAAAPGVYTGIYTDDDRNPGVRGVAVDRDGNVWLGTYDTQTYYHVDGQTGALRRVVHFSSVNHKAYGAVIDARGILWSSGLDTQNLLRLDPATGLFRTVDLGHTTYGLGLDRSNHLFVAGWRSTKLTRLDVASGAVEWTVGGVYESRGVAVTEDGDVWTADSGPGTVTRWSNDGLIRATIPVGATPTGVTVDAGGKVWVVNYGDEYVKRIDPQANRVDLEKRIIGGLHYGYSDMTGILSRTATLRYGTWTVVHDSRLPGAAWGRLDWTGVEPEGTRITVRVRTSADRRHWSGWETAVSGERLQATPAGKYLEVDVTLQSAAEGSTPVLYDLSVAPTEDASLRPTLQFRALEDGAVELFWDLGLTGVMLEWSDRVDGMWQAVEGVAGNRHVLVVAEGAKARLYRLRITASRG